MICAHLYVNSWTSTSFLRATNVFGLSVCSFALKGTTIRANYEKRHEITPEDP